MALPQEALDLDAQRLVIVNKIAELKKESAELKRRYDHIVEMANLEHKLGQLSDKDLLRLQSLLDKFNGLPSPPQ